MKNPNDRIDSDGLVNYLESKKLTKTLPKISRFQKLPSCEALYRHFNSVEKILLFFSFQVLLCFKIGAKHRKLN